MTYVCQQLADRPNIYGEYACKSWVISEQQYQFSLVSQLAITKADMVAIGGSLTAVFALFVAYALIVKAVKMM